MAQCEKMGTFSKKSLRNFLKKIFKKIIPKRTPVHFQETFFLVRFCFRKSDHFWTFFSCCAPRSATKPITKLINNSTGTTTARSNSIISDEIGYRIADKVQLSEKTNSSVISTDQRERIAVFLKNSTTSEFRIGKYVKRFN